MTDRFVQLGALLKELSNGANPFRLRQIESTLSGFRSSETSWDDARQILEQQTDSHMQYFALSIYEEWIATKWALVPDARKSDLLYFLFDLAVQSNKPLVHYVYMYLLKVIAHVGRLDWPKRAPEFLTRAMELAATPETCTLGVTLLKVISEEWTNTRSRIKSTRRLKVRQMLAEEVPNIVAIFSQILVSLWTDNVQQTSGSSFDVLDINANYISNFGNNNDAAELAKLVLSALQVYIAWAPINLVLQPSHIDILFKYAVLNDTTSCLALDNLNEMLERNFVPVELSNFLVQLHAASLALLGKMVRDEATLSTLDPEYISKWTQFINLFVQYHLRRDESLNFADFLMLFGKFTFAQPTNEGWLDCLDIWEVILNLLDTHVVNNVSIAPFTDVVCEFAVTLMRYITFRDNGAQLSSMQGGAATDGTALTDEEEESELDTFINAALTAISIAYSLYPETLQAPLVAKTTEPVADFLNLHTVIGSNMNDQQVETVYCTVRDTTTAVRAMALIGSQFMNHFDATFADASTLIRTLVDLTTYIKQHELQKYSPEAARLAAELFGAMRAFSDWCGFYWSELQNTPNSDCSTFDEIISAMITCDGLALQSRSLGVPEEPANVPELIPLSAAVHLRYLATMTKSPRLAELGVVSQLLADAHALATLHTADVQQSMYVGLTFVYLVPWHGLQANAQQWPARAAAFSTFIEGLLQPFEQAATPIITREISPQTVAVKEILDKSMVILTGIVRESASRLDKSGLTILWNALQDCLKGSLELLEFYIDDLPMLFRLLQLHIQVFSVLAPYVPTELASSMLTAVITNLSTQNRLETLLADVGGFGTAVSQRLLSLLKALVSRPAAPFLGEAFNFCIERIYPSILEGMTSIEVEQSFYEVWCELLLRHYKFCTQNEEIYRTTLMCILRALQGQDLDIYKLVVGSLLSADQKHHLFSQAIFWTVGYMPFLEALFHIIIQRSHESLQEDILKLVYQIIQGSNFDPFFDEFLPSFLIDTTFFQITQDQRNSLILKLGRHTDPPTLTKGIENLLNDLAFLSGALNPT